MTSARWLVGSFAVVGALACAHRAAPHPTYEEASPPPTVLTPLDGGVQPTSSLAGFDAGSPDAGRSALAAGPTLSERDNPHALVGARCQQQERCGLVRQGGKYMMPEQCLAAVLEEQRDALVKYSCPANTDVLALQSCLEAVRAMDCNAPFQGFHGIAQCNTARVCRGTNATLPAP